MFSLVSNPSLFLAKALTTLLALVRVQSRVTPLVPEKLVQLAEPLAALQAFIRAGRAVGFQVDHQVVFPEEAFVALRALIGFHTGVDFPMAVQLSLPREAPPAILAYVRLFSRVGVFMIHEVTFCRKRFFAHFTLMLLFRRGLLSSLESGSVAIRCAAFRIQGSSRLRRSLRCWVTCRQFLTRLLLGLPASVIDHHRHGSDARGYFCRRLANSLQSGSWLRRILYHHLVWLTVAWGEKKK